MHHSTPLITTIVGGLVLAFLFGMIFNRFKVTPIVGYLLAGIVVGPFTPGFKEVDVGLAKELAELGVILLMFGVGLHFSAKDLLSVKNIAVPGAILQILAATVLGGFMGHFFLDLDIMPSIIFGLCLSTASTVVLLRSLEEQDLIETTRGKIAIGWLVVEDIMMILALVLIPLFATMMKNDALSSTEIFSAVGITFGKVILFIVLMMLFGVKIIPKILARTAATNSRELFTLSILGVSLGIAYISSVVFDVSFALGAFFAGLVLAESKFSHRAAEDILPLKDAFAVLFFVSVGMLFDPSIIISSPFSILFTAFIIIFGKSAVAYYLVTAYGKNKRTALTISVSLAQIGEFAFILASLGITLELIGEKEQNLILAGAIISILLNPILFTAMEKYLAVKEALEEQKKSISPVIDSDHDDEDEKLLQQPIDLSFHMIVAHCGQLGDMLVQNLSNIEGVDFAVIDESKATVTKLMENHIPAYWGDYKNKEHLLDLNIQRAKAIIFATANVYAVIDVIKYVKEINPEIKVVAYANYKDEVSLLSKHGADFVINKLEELADKMMILCHQHIFSSGLEKNQPQENEDDHVGVLTQAEEVNNSVS